MSELGARLRTVPGPLTGRNQYDVTRTDLDPLVLTGNDAVPAGHHQQLVTIV